MTCEQTGRSRRQGRRLLFSPAGGKSQNPERKQMTEIILKDFSHLIVFKLAKDGVELYPGFIELVLEHIGPLEAGSGH